MIRLAAACRFGLTLVISGLLLVGLSLNPTVALAEEESLATGDITVIPEDAVLPADAGPLEATDDLFDGIDDDLAPVLDTGLLLDGLGGLMRTALTNDGMSRPTKDGEESLLSIGGRVREFMSDPTVHDTINRVVLPALTRDSGIPFLRDIDLSLKTFEQDGDGNDLEYGIAYKYAQEIREHEVDFFDVDYGQLHFDIAASGNIAFDSDTNPEDFLEFGASFGFFGSWGGKYDYSEVTDATKVRYQAAKKVAKKIKDKDELHRSDAYRTLLAIGRDSLSDQFSLDLSGNIQLESDQSFDTMQMVYGANLGLVYAGWEKFDAETWDEASACSRWNVFDYPGAFIRWVTRYNDGFAPSCLNLPAIRVGVAAVDPVDGDPRKAFGDGGTFARLDTEVDFRTPLFALSDMGGLLDLVGTVYFSANHRFWHELDAADAVESAGLDSYDYFVATLGTTSGAFFSYSTGSVPFDAGSDQVYQLGFKSHL